MFIRDRDACPAIVAGDHTMLREILHPDKDALDIRYSLAHAVVLPGEASLPHRLRNAEVYYLISGVGIMYIDRADHPVRAGQTIYIPPGAEQWIRNTGTGELAFLCIVDPAWQPEDEEVSDSDDSSD